MRMVFCIGLLFSGITLVSAETFSKVTIEEAFISRKTSLQFKDAHSAAEFGFKIYFQKKFIHRGSQLYADLYYPGAPTDGFELSLVERDVFRDDHVARVKISSPGQHRLTANGDFVIVKIEAFDAEALSGKDRALHEARACPQKCEGSISFVKKDKTDYLRLPRAEYSLIITSRRVAPPVLVKGGSLLYGSTSSFKSKEAYSNLVKQSGPPAILKVADRIGGYGHSYQVFSGSGQQVFQFAVDFIKKKRSGWVESKSLGHALHQAIPQKLQSFCQGLPEKDREELVYRNFCKPLKQARKKKK